MSVPRSRNVVKVAFQKDQGATKIGGPSSATNTFEARAEDVGDGPSLTSRALGAGKKSRPNLHPSLSTDSLSSITDNIEKNGNRESEEDGLGSGISTPVRKLANLTIIRPPKLKQLKNLQQLLLQYQQQYYSLKQQKVSESRSNSPLPIPGNPGKSTASQTPFLYVIDAIWLRKWLHYITTEQSSSLMNDKADSRSGSPTFNGEESHAPGSITNWNLIEEQAASVKPNGEEVPLTLWKNQRVSTSSKEYINGHYKLKPDLQEGQDYYLLPVEAWNALYNWYSGGPPLPRFLFNVLQVYVTDDYYPLSISLMELFFVTPSQSLEKKVLTSNEITTLTKEKILEYYQEVEEEGLNSPQKRKIQGIADEKKLLLADLYPPNSDNIPSVKDTHDFLGITIAPTTPMALSPTRFHHSHHNSSNGTDVTAEQQKKFFPLMNAFEAIPEEDLSKSVENSPVPTITKNLPRPAPTTTTNTTVPPPPPPTPSTTTSKDSNGSTTESTSTASKSVPVGINHCAVCGDLAKTRCGQCSFLFYCTKECQKIHWKYHKTSCKTIKERSLALQSKGAALKKEDLNAKDQALIYGKQGKVGLHNLGNSCYMNSSLQCLIHIIPLTKYLLSGRYLNDINVSNRDGTKGELVKVYATLIQDIYLDNKAVLAPSLLKKVLGNINDEYAGFNQQDAHEVIELLLDKLHEDINRIIIKPYTMKLEGDGSNDIMIARDTWNRHLLRHSSYIQELFGCLMRSQLTCPTCSKISVSYEYHNTIQVAIPRNYNITITILFIPEIPSSKYESNDGNVEINLRTISSQWSNFLPKKVTLTVDRYTSIKSLKKQLLLHLTSFQRSIYNESNIFFFESMNPSKRVENNIKYIKYLKDIILINSLSSSNTILLAYGMTLASLSSHHFLFIHMRTMEILESPNNNDDDAEDDVSIHYTGYPLLLSYDRTSWSCQRTRHHIWLNTIRYFQPSSTYVKESLEYLTTSNIMKQMEISQHFPIRLISNDGGPMMSVDHKRLLALAKKKKGNGVFPPPPMDDLDLSFGSILPSDRSLMIEEFTGDIERLYPSGAIYFSLDVIVEAKPIIDYQHLKSLDAVITTRSAAVASSLSSSPTNNKNGNNNNHNILTLDDCLKEYTKEEILEVGNEWYCNKCQEHKQAYKIMQFHYSYLPNILILTLKRFEYRDISSLMGGGYNSNNMIHREKIDHFIDFPIYGLNLKKYCTGITAGSTSTKKSSTEESGVTEMQKEVISNEDEGKKEMKKEGEEVKKEDGKNNDEDDDEEENDAIYDLFAICNHYGRMGFGHYTAYVKDWALYEEATQTTVPNKPPSTGGWYLYDDNSVVKVSEKEIKTSSAYILFYRKRNLHY